MSERNTGGMGRLASGTANRTNNQLADAEAAVLASTAVTLDLFRPRVTDKAAFDTLVNAVNKSTAANESIAQLKQRLTDLGTGVIQVAREVAAFL